MWQRSDGLLAAGTCRPGGRDLRSSRISKPYRRRLRVALSQFACWLIHSCRPPLEEVLNSAVQAASCLADYGNFLYAQSPVRHSDFKHAILAVQTVRREFRGLLTEAWDTLGSWHMKIPFGMRVPMVRELLWAMFAQALTLGFVLNTSQAGGWLCSAVAFLTGYHAMLRPGELGALRRADIELPDLEGPGDPVVVLSVKSPKNFRAMGRIQTAVIRDMVTIRWLIWLCRDVPRSSLLFPGGLPNIKKFFYRLLTFMELVDLGLTVGSLRAGRATDLFIQGIEITRLRVMGRWKNITTLDHYVQEASSYRVSFQLADDTRARVRELLALARPFRVPPRDPWQRYFERRAEFGPRGLFGGGDGGAKGK